MTTISRLFAAAALLGALGAAGLAAAQDRRPEGFGPGRLDFAAIDTDGNGALGRGELVARSSERVTVLDVNGDGALARDELVAAMPMRGGLLQVFSIDPAEAMADRVLAMHGATAAGRVEVAAMAEQMVNMLLARLDTDRDDALSEAEADAVASRHAERGGHGGHMGRPRF